MRTKFPTGALTRFDCAGDWSRPVARVSAADALPCGRGISSPPDSAASAIAQGIAAMQRRGLSFRHAASPYCVHDIPTRKDTAARRGRFLSSETARTVLAKRRRPIFAGGAAVRQRGGLGAADLERAAEADMRKSFDARRPAPRPASTASRRPARAPRQRPPPETVRKKIPRPGPPRRQKIRARDLDGRRGFRPRRRGGGAGSTRWPAWTSRWRMRRGSDNSGVTATVAALSRLDRKRRPECEGRWLGSRTGPKRPHKSEGGIALPDGDRIRSRPASQPRAIADLVAGIDENERTQVPARRHRLGQDLHHGQGDRGERSARRSSWRPTRRWPRSSIRSSRTSSSAYAVEYFVSYYDYYQPRGLCAAVGHLYREGIPRSTSRSTACSHSATRSLLERERRHHRRLGLVHLTVFGSVQTYNRMTFQMQVGDRIDQRQLLADLGGAAIQRRADGRLRARLVPRCVATRSRSSPPTSRSAAWRVSLFGDEIEQITEFDPLTGQKTGELKSVKIYANSHYVTPRPDAQPGDQVDQGRAEAPARRAGEGGPPAGGPAAGAAHALRPRNA